MTKGSPPDEIRLPRDPGLAGVRSYLEYVRRSSPKDAAFTISRDIEIVFGTSGPIRDERDLVEYVLRFANGETDRSEIRRLLASGRGTMEPVDSGDQLSHQQQLDADASAIEGMRTKYRAFLERCAEHRTREAHRDRAAADFVKSAADVKSAAESLQRIWILPSVRFVSGSAQLQYHTIILDLSAFEAFVRLLILDEDRQIGRDLCQCGLERCSKFFLAVKPPTGRPKRKYCCPEHMEEFNKRDGAERTRKSRAGKNVRKPK